VRWHFRVNRCSRWQSVQRKMILKLQIWLRDNVIKPLLRLGIEPNESPYYVYFNVDSASHLRQVLKNPKKYAPNGIYIMRIHGTFVNILDMSPAIQEDIIMRIEPGGTT